VILIALRGTVWNFMPACSRGLQPQSSSSSPRRQPQGSKLDPPSGHGTAKSGQCNRIPQCREPYHPFIPMPCSHSQFSCDPPRSSQPQTYLSYSHPRPISRVYHHDDSIRIFEVGGPEGPQILLPPKIPNLRGRCPGSGGRGVSDTTARANE
jgi:hypothetical protein